MNIYFWWARVTFAWNSPSVTCEMTLPVNHCSSSVSANRWRTLFPTRIRVAVSDPSTTWAGCAASSSVGSIHDVGRLCCVIKCRIHPRRGPVVLHHQVSDPSTTWAGCAASSSVGSIHDVGRLCCTIKCRIHPRRGPVVLRHQVSDPSTTWAGCAASSSVGSIHDVGRLCCTIKFKGVFDKQLDIGRQHLK